MPFICKECKQNFVVSWFNEIIGIVSLGGGALVILLSIITLDFWIFIFALGFFIFTILVASSLSDGTEEYCKPCMKKINLDTIQQVMIDDPIAGQIITKRCMNGINNYKIITESDVEIAKFVKKRIESLIHLGKYTEAIKILEEYGLEEEAGQIRKNSRVIKTVNLDVNELVDQINEYGSVKSLICNNCGAPIGKNEIAEGRKFSSFCGGAYDLLTVNEVLREMLNIDATKIIKKEILHPKP